MATLSRAARRGLGEARALYTDHEGEREGPERLRESPVGGGRAAHVGVADDREWLERAFAQRRGHERAIAHPADGVAVAVHAHLEELGRLAVRGDDVDWNDEAGAERLLAGRRDGDGRGFRERPGTKRHRQNAVGRADIIRLTGLHHVRDRASAASRGSAVEAGVVAAVVVAVLARDEQRDRRSRGDRCSTNEGQPAHRAHLRRVRPLASWGGSADPHQGSLAS